MNQYDECEDLVLVQYQFSKDKIVPPSKKCRTYPSIKRAIDLQLDKGLCPKRAVYVVEADQGGIENVRNASALPNRTQAYTINKTKSQKEDDPLKKLLFKQREDGCTGHSVIQKISFDVDSYTVVLFTKRMMDNISNFCCHNTYGYLSALSMDFTFELGDFFVLVTTFKNTSLYVKKKKTSPSMLGPVLLCHKKSERAVKMLFETMLEEKPALENRIRVIGMDGETAIINSACLSFPSAVLLLCLNHAKKNIKQKLLYDLKMPNEDIMAVVKDIFGCETSSGLIHSGTPTDYDQQVRVLLEKWNIMSGKHQEFAIYFQENKQEQFKYHLCRYSVKASQVVDCSDFFYNNSCEFINKLLKLWQGKKKVDCLKFAEQIQDLARCQEGDVLRAYMSMPSPFLKIKI